MKGVIVRAGVVVTALVCAACPRASAPTHEATVFFRGEAVGRVVDTVDGRHIERHEHLSTSGEDIVTTADLDDVGLAVSARYQRGAVRTVVLATKRLTDDSGASAPLTKRALLIDLLRFAQPKVRTEVELVDLSSGEAVPGTVERRGAEVVALDSHGAVVARVNVEGLRTGPGAFTEGDAAEALDVAPVALTIPVLAPRGLRLLGIDDALASLSLDGPGQARADASTLLFDPAHAQRTAPVDAERAPALFLESADPAVIAFARAHGGGREPLLDAATVVDAVHGLVDAHKTDVPPSARAMLAQGGDCDGAAALVTASLRALGHAARPVVGYRIVDNTLKPHAWAEVWVPADGWVSVDATLPRVGTDASHVRLFTGLGGALSMGRVLGRLRIEPVL